ncbi:MAG: indolepyruvate ferredoxin oxidoreductase [Rhodobacteraceae bacterium PARR1]|nr:MAG: indolepyruvate ferredoxin oxidoreductase [Rhodobacteraceae bacterium PARR1]
MKIDLPARRPRRRINLTPMIDVVLMLLVFFMMVSRFGGTQGIGLTVASGQGTAWSGPPRLVDLGAEGVRLNGIAVTLESLPAALGPLMVSPDDPVILRTDEGASVQGLVDAMTALRGAGIGNLIVAGSE